MSEPLSKRTDREKNEIKRARVHGTTAESTSILLSRSLDHRADPGNSLLFSPTSLFSRPLASNVQIYHDKLPQSSCGPRSGTVQFERPPVHEPHVQLSGTPTRTRGYLYRHFSFWTVFLRRPRRTRREFGQWHTKWAHAFSFFGPSPHSCRALLLRNTPLRRHPMRRATTVFSNLGFWMLSSTFLPRYRIRITGYKYRFQASPSLTAPTIRVQCWPRFLSTAHNTRRVISAIDIRIRCNSYLYSCRDCATLA